MRRVLLALPFTVLAGGVCAQTAGEPVILQMDFDHFDATATLGGAKQRFAAAAGVLQYEPGKPETSALSLSFDTTSLGNAGARTALDAGHYPEIRIASTGPASGSPSSVLSFPAIVTIGEVTRPGTIRVSYKLGPGGSMQVHAESAVKSADFALKGASADISFALDAPFLPAGSVRVQP